MNILYGIVCVLLGFIAGLVRDHIKLKETKAHVKEIIIAYEHTLNSYLKVLDAWEACAEELEELKKSEP